MTHLVGDISINYGVSLVVLVYDIERLSVPYSQMEALAIHNIVTKNALQLAHFSLEVYHDFRG